MVLLVIIKAGFYFVWLPKVLNSGAMHWSQIWDECGKGFVNIGQLLGQSSKTLYICEPLEWPWCEITRFLDSHMPNFNKDCHIVPTCLCQLHFHYLCRRVLITLDTQHLISSDWNVCQLSKEEMLFHGFHFAFFKLLISFYCN